MAVIGFSTSMLANTTDVTYTEPTFTADGNKPFSDSKFKYSYVQSIELKNGEVTKTWKYSEPRTFWNVLESMTMDAKAGETISAHFVANSLGNYSTVTVKQDLRFTAVVLAIDWNGDGTFEYAQKIVGNVPPTHNVGGNMDVLDFNYDIKVPEDVQPGTARVRFNYTNAWLQDIAPKQPETIEQYTQRAISTCKEGIVYDFDINIVEPIESGLEVTWEQPENGTITVKNGTEVLESPATVESGTKLTIVPAPASGRYELGTLTANDTPITLNDGNYEVTINENTVIAATFEIAKYEINWNEPVNGTIKVVYANDESQEVTKGSKVQLDTELKVIAEPSTSGYVLNRVYYVYGNGTEYDITKGDNGYTFTVQETTNGIKTIYINAVFEKVVKYRITWAGEETMQGNSLKVVYADTDEEVLNSETLVTEGSVLKIIPTAVAGYHLSALSYTISGLQNVPFTIGNEPYTFTVEGGTEDPKMGYFVIISAGFTPDTYTLSTSVNPAEGGSVSVTTTDGTTIKGNVTHGQTIVITASANDGYTFQSLDVKGATKVDGQENQYTVEGDVTVTATFVEDAPAETWTEVHFNTMSGKDVDFYNDPYYMNPAKSWSKVNSGATVTGDKNNGLYIKQLTAGYYLAYKYRVEKEATYRFSFVHKKGETKDITVKLCYTKDLESTFTDASAATEIPQKGGGDSGDLFQSNNVVLEPGDYYFVYYIETAATGDIKVRIADFKLEMLDGSAVEPTPEYTVTLNKPENGNLSVTYNNGTDNVTVSTDKATEAQTFNVTENTKLTVTVTPADGYQLATLSPEMTKVEESENVYEYTVTEPVTIEATFTEIPETDPIIGVGTDSATAPIVSTASSPTWFVMKSSHLTVAERQNRFMYWNEENSRLECTQHNDGIKLSEISDAYRWRFEDAEDGNIYIINKATGKALSVPANASSETGNANINTPLTLEETGSKWSFALSSTVNPTQALPNQYCFDYVDYAEADRAAYLNAMDGQAAIPYGITIYEMGVQNASGWFIYEAPAIVKNYDITVKKPVNGNLVISYTVNDEMQSIETYNFENDSEVFSIEEGTVLSISANPEFDYVLDQILPEGMEEKIGLAGDKYYEYTVTGDATIEATFKPVQYGKVSAETPEEGTIEIQLHNPMMNKWVAADEFFLEQVEFGTELRAKVEANTGYELVSVMKNQEELSTEEEGYYYFTVDAEEITISAEFEAEEYTLTTEVNPAEGGSVSVTVNGVTVEGSVKYGDVITVTVTVNEGYLLESVVVEGAEEVEGQKDQYTVTGNITITATFKKDTSSINSIENGTVYYNAEEEVLYTGTAKSVRVYDLSGRLVLNAENQENVSLAELAEGVYTAVVDGKIIKLNK